MTTVAFNIACDADLADAVTMVADHQAEQSWEWWRTERRAIRATLTSGAARRAALAELRDERDRRRRAGEHFDNRSAVLAYYVTSEMDGRGWRQKWPPIPHELPGRRWGSANALAGPMVNRLDLNLPRELAERLRRATWHVSQPGTLLLQQNPAMDRDERDRLRATIVTTADVIRAAAAAAVDALPVPEPEPASEPALPGQAVT